MNGGHCYIEKSGSTFIEFCLCPADHEGEQCGIKKTCDLPCAYGECKFPYIPPSALTDLELNTDPYCFCEKGYSGVYCETPIDTCPDGKRSCYNGAECEELFHPDGRAFLTPRYKCNCEDAGNKKNPYAGLNCHIPAEKVCSLLTDKVVSFCVNGGTCKDITTVEGAHFGCHCQDGFEGDHCEFLGGSDPVENAKLASTLENGVKEVKPMVGTTAGNSTGRKRPGGIDGILLFTVVLLAFGAILGILVTIGRISRKEKAFKEAATDYKADDVVAFDGDGNKMTNISIGEDPVEGAGEII